MRHSPAVKSSIANRAFPGASYGYGGPEDYLVGAEGTITYTNSSNKVTPFTLFDLASLTKVIATTASIMVLFQESAIDLNQRLGEVIPEFSNNGKENLTLLHLLYHCSGLVSFRSYEKNFVLKSRILQEIFTESLESEIGEYVYSDLNFMLLAEFIERITGQDVSEFSQKNVFAPLGMINTMFCPHGSDKERCAPTEVVDKWRLKWHDSRGEDAFVYSVPDEVDPSTRYIRGEVHDERAAIFEGITGHAGLFSCANDLALFACEILEAMKGRGKVFEPQTILTFTHNQYLPFLDREPSFRLLGWHGVPDQSPNSAGAKISKKAFGHLGFTGTSLWIDPGHEFFHFLLSNRVHPTRENDQIANSRISFADEVTSKLD